MFHTFCYTLLSGCRESRAGSWLHAAAERCVAVHTRRTAAIPVPPPILARSQPPSPPPPLLNELCPLPQMPISETAPQGTRGLDLPGPGAYSPATDQRGGNYLGDAPSFSMAARKVTPKPEPASPGPIYAPQKITRTSMGPIGDAPLYSFGTSERLVSCGSKDPGPGQYTQSLTRSGSGAMDGPKYGFGTSAQRVSSSAHGGRFISREHSVKSE